MNTRNKKSHGKVFRYPLTTTYERSFMKGVRKVSKKLHLYEGGPKSVKKNCLAIHLYEGGLKSLKKMPRYAFI